MLIRLKYSAKTPRTVFLFCLVLHSVDFLSVLKKVSIFHITTESYHNFEQEFLSFHVASKRISRSQPQNVTDSS
jgi:hypothetical protein